MVHPSRPPPHTHHTLRISPPYTLRMSVTSLADVLAAWLTMYLPLAPGVCVASMCAAATSRTSAKVHDPSGTLPPGASRKPCTHVMGR